MQNLSKSVKGRRHQAVSDATVSRDLDKILLKLEKESDPESHTSTPSSPVNNSKEDLQHKDVKTPQKGMFYY